MYAIAHHEPGKAASVKTQPIYNADDIKLWWAGGAQPAIAKKVEETLQQMCDDKVWIACTCTGDKTNPPISTVVKRSDTGTLFLVRLHARANHDKNCAFIFKKKEANPAGPAPVPGGRGGNKKPAVAPSFFDEEVDATLADPKKPKTKREPKGPRGEPTGQNKLAAQLKWLLEKSGMQVWPMSNLSPAQMLLSTAANEMVKNGLTLDRILYCRADAWKSNWVEGAFKACKEKKLNAQAVLICPVVDANKEESWVKFEKDGTPVSVSGQLNIYGGDDAQARYPMLMYARIKKREGDGKRIVSAYLHPMLDYRQWMLVDSEYERQAFAIIQSVCFDLEHKDISCIIEKPVYELDETGATPDFIVTGEKEGLKHSLIVETMGITDPEYRERKKGTVEKLAGHAVFEDYRYKQDDTVDLNLRKYVYGFMNGKFKVTGST
jgi:hypothetical protein